MKITKTAAAFLAAAITFPVISVSADAENTITADGIEYIINEDGTASVINVTDKKITAVVIPEKVKGYRVTGLGDFEGTMIFEGCEDLRSVTIPISIEYIGDWCFYYVPELKDVYYSGSGEQWRTILIGENNDILDEVLHLNADKPEIEDIPDLVISGDIDGNGIVTAGDATLVLKHAADLITLEGDALNNADVNGDGIINAKDATAILKIAAGLE